MTEFDALLRHRLLDAGYYGAQVGRKFADRRAAGAHLVATGARSLRMFHPLVSPDYMPADVVAAWKAGAFDDVVAFLLSERGVQRAWSPWFDPRDLRGDRAADRILGLEALLSSLERETVLPQLADLGAPRQTYGELRRHLVARARAIRRQTALRRARWTSQWDDAAEAAWLRAVPPVEPTVEAPCISVVMPVWNRAERVREAIESVRSQTLGAWELIVVDDGSVDGSADIAQAEADADPRIVVVRAPHAGVSAARNAGLERASAPLVAFLDSDNAWRPHYLATMVAAMHRDSLQAAYSAERRVDENGRTWYLAFDGTREHLLVENHIDLNVLVVATQVARRVGGFDEQMRRWVDHDFALRVAAEVELAFLPFIGCEYDETGAGSDRISVRESPHWEFVALGKAHVDWAALADGVPTRVPGRVSVVIPTFQDVVMTSDAVKAVLVASDGHDVEVVVVDNGSDPRRSLQLAALELGPNVLVHRIPRNLNFAIGSNVGFSLSSGQLVVFLNNDTRVRPGWLGPLTAALEDAQVRGAQPLLVYPDDTIQAAGTVFPARDAMPVHVAVGHPYADGRAMEGVRFSAVTAAALLMRAEEVVALRGFDPIFVNGSEDIDLCLRAVQARGGWFAVVPDSVVEHRESKTPGRGARIDANREIFMKRWRGGLPGPERAPFDALGLRVAHVGSGGGARPTPRLVLVRDPRSAVDAAGGPVPCLRWNIKSAAQPGPLGLKWGDTHFIAALSESLRRNGQEVVVSSHGTHDQPATVFDDVNLVVRGLDRVHAQPGVTNVLWVISHPDDVSLDEIREYDLVFAASQAWARRMTELSGREVRPLLQATDPDRFVAAAPRTDLGSSAVFVGQARPDGPRQIVMDALDAGLPVRVWGPRWARHVPPDVIDGEFVANDELAAVYAGAALVLNDHWGDMAREGFVSNRVFDAVAAGARVLSDPVDGLESIFGGSVMVYREPRELAGRTLASLVSSFPPAEERADIAARIAREHSFDRRAEVLLGAVVAHEAARRGVDTER